MIRTVAWSVLLFDFAKTKAAVLKNTAVFLLYF